MPLFRPQQSGQSLLEVMIALALMAILFTASFIALSGQLVEMSRGKDSLRALALAKEGLEASRLIRDRGWSELSPGAHGLTLAGNQWQFQSTSDTQTNLTRSVTVSDIAANERLVSSEVRWSAPTGMRQIRLTTHLSNWRNAIPPLLSGNWQNPQTLSSIDLGSGIEVTALTVRSRMVYLTGQSSSGNKPDFFIVDATDGVHPILRGTLHLSDGANDVAVSGQYAFVANQLDEPGEDQLKVITINDPQTPGLVASLGLMGNEESALSISVAGSYGYIGTKNSSNGPELYMVDITNPLSPIVRGSLEIGADIHRIAVQGDRLILATSKDTAELIVVDASNPTSPTQSGFYNAAGTNDALGLYVNPQDNRAYLTRSSGSISNPDILIIDLTTPDAPILLGTHVLNTNVNAVFAADNLAFFATSFSSEEFKIFEVSDPTSLTSYSGLNFPQVGIDLGFENNTIYAAARSNDALRIITSQ